MRWMRNAIRKMRNPGEYLIYTLHGSYKEFATEKQPFPKRLISSPSPNLDQVRQDLQVIAKDYRIKGVIFQLDQLSLSLAKIEGLRQILSELKADKELIIWAKSYTLETYYLATKADQIYLQPGGGIAPLGVSRDYLFFSNALADHGLAFEAWQISPYKSAADIFTRTDMAPEVREMANWLVEANFLTIINAISKERNLPVDQVRSLIDKSPYSDLEAHEHKLIDEITSIEEISQLLGGVRIKTYEQAKKHMLLPAKTKGKKQIALIRVEGNIIDGKSSKPMFNVSVPLVSGPKEGDLTVVQKIRQAQSNKKIAAVVFYIDSGGGSATASEAIHSALKNLAKVKPVVVQMGSVAGSGGYYIACPAHYIFAQPNTTTGSIGVLAGKFIDQGFSKKYKITQESVFRGKNALFNSFFHPFTDEQREKGRNSIERFYELFITRVAEGRNLSLEQVKAVSNGKVWTGTQALEHGLIDELGGITQAIEKAAQLANLKSPVPVREITTSKKTMAPPPLSDTATMLIKEIEAINRSHCLLISPLSIWENVD